MNQTLPDLRAEIDSLDEELATLLARRVAVLDRVIAVKAGEGTPARLTDRVDEVIGNARDRAEAKGIDPDLAERLWREIVEWSIAYEERRLGNAATSGDA